MILSAGLTPAWQQILTFRHFQPGEVNRAQSAHWCASGKVLNVASALHQLGASARTVCLIGGLAGQQMQHELEQQGIPVRWVHSAAHSRICTTILDLSSGTTTELVENSPPVSTAELDSFRAAFADEVRAASTVLLTGSLPADTPAWLIRELLEMANVRAVLDIRGPELEEALACRPYVVKPNREELSRTVGRSLESEAELIAAMSEIRHRGAEWVVVSSGPEPLRALGPQGLIRIEPPRVNVVNPIGCGDCLAAGIAAGLDLGWPMERALEAGVKAAAENVQELLPARRLSRLA